MANQLTASQLVSNLGLATLTVSSPYVMTSDRSYDIDFMNSEYQTGQVLNVRKNIQYNAYEGRITPDQDTIEDTIPITIEPQINVPVVFNSRELALYMTKDPDKYQRRYGDPAIQAALALLETKIGTRGKTDLNYWVGSPTAAFSDFSLVDITGSRMTELGMPMERVNMTLQSSDMSALKASNQNAFNSTLNTEISFGSKLASFSRFDLYETANVVKQIAGSGAGNPLVSGTITNGFTVTLSGFTANATRVVAAGDGFTIGNINDATGVQSMHPRTHQPTGQLMQFSVLSDVNADGSGNATVTIAAPTAGIISDTADPRINVSQPLPNGATFNLLGAGTTYRVAYAYVSRGLALVMPPLPYVPAPECHVAKDVEHGLSIRVVRYYDGKNDLSNGRLDLLHGERWFDQYAMKVISRL
jgi:hypothetical protein